MCTGRLRAGHTCRPLSTSTTRKVHYIIRGALYAPSAGATSA